MKERIRTVIAFVKENKTNILEFIKNFLLHFLLIMLLETVTKKITRNRFLFIQYSICYLLC